MSLQATLRVVVDALDTAGVPFMLSGSVASGFHGEPRSTQDIDLVIDPPSPEALDAFVRAIDPERFYVNDHRRAFAERSMFNVIDTTNGWKVDLIVRHDRPYSREEFARRLPAEVEGVRVYLASAEDVVLSKVEWSVSGSSPRQLEDARSVVRASEGALDRSYLERWADRLGIADAVAVVLSDAT